MLPRQAWGWILACVALGSGLTAAEDTGEENHNIKKRAITPDTSTRWEKAIVPYRLLDNMDADRLNSIQRGMRTWERYTCVRFAPLVDDNGVTTTNQQLGLSHPGHLVFGKFEGCYSSLGNTHKKNGQDISCCTGTACLHELGHALGMQHEQQSPDPSRNRFIRVQPEYISEGKDSWYSQLSGKESKSSGYDVSSIMHYTIYEFNKDDEQSFVHLFPEMKEHTSHYYMMKEVSEEYKCEDECSHVNLVCENDGYLTKVDGICTCRCVPGLDPATGCTTIYKKDPPELDFPGGQYALPAHTSGCPDGSFLTGSRSRYTSGNIWKNPSLPMKMEFSNKKLTENFCVKDAEPNDFIWPGGRYCIYRRGGSCPDGFAEGFVQYDDSPIDPKTNTKSGYLPDGVFGEDTRFEYCCKNTGFIEDELYLPSRKPFLLMKYYWGDKCHKIRGMHEHFYTLKIPNSGPLASRGGKHPVYQVKDGAYYTHYCAYTPAMIDCGAVYELDASNPEVTFSSPAGTDRECFWLIKAPPGQRLTLDFSSFNIKGTYPKSCADKVEVRYNRPGQPGLFYCGSSWEKTTISINNTIHLRMSTWSSGESHFTATAKLWKDEDMCYDVADFGMTYAGDVDYTRDFEPCLPWHEMTHCENHPFNMEIFNDILDGNKCRNPNQVTGMMPWCYTSKEQCRRNYCDVCQLGRRYDTRTDCDDRRAAGTCPLDGCAKSCADLFTQPAPPTQVSQVRCGAPPNVPDGKPLNAQTSYAIGQSVTYKCNRDGGSKDRWCLSTGQWSPMGTACYYCPDGWHLFNNHCYRVLDGRYTYSNAISMCSRQRANLVTVKSEKENDFIERLAPSFVWLGLTDKDTEDSFKWMDGAPLDYSNWQQGEPNNRDGNEDCVAMWRAGKWIDVSCVWDRYDVICQKEKIEISCSDYSDKCKEHLSAYPSMCQEFPDFAATNCQYTCGRCKEKQTPWCSIRKTTRVTTIETRTKIPLGTSVTFTCAEGFVPSGGDAVRACTESGTLSGDPLQCLKYECEPGWTLNQVTRSCYRYFTKHETYSVAESTCETHGATLVTIADYDEQDFVSELRGSADFIWIGLDDRRKESVFEWVDGSEVTYRYWSPNEPNNYGSGEDCGVMWKSGRWNDMACTYFVPFVCKAGAVAAPVDPDLCPVEQAGPNSLTTETRAEVPIGASVTYTCKDGFSRSGGDTVRRCTEAKTLSGSPLQCSEISCPPGWRANKANFNCYGKLHAPTNFAKSQKECQSRGGQLAMPKNAEEQAFVDSMRESGYIWIGLHGKKEESVFTWVDGSATDYTNWNTGEPNNALWGEDCAIMVDGGGWNDIGCGHALSFICQVDQRPKCPSGWTANSANSHCYRLYTVAKSFVSAESECESHGGTLATAKDEEEEALLDSLRGSGQIWLGLDDRDQEGVFTWSDGSEATGTDTYTNWNTGQPNNGGWGEDCGMIQSTGGWNDSDCLSQVNYVCKILLWNVS